MRPGKGRARLGSGLDHRSDNTDTPSLVVPLLDPLDELARHIDGAFVLVVKVTGGKYRRRCFLTAASAERAARRAQDAGHSAEVFLAELRPLWRLTGGAR